MTETKYVELTNFARPAANANKNGKFSNGGNGNASSSPKGFTPFVGTCFTVNFIMGTGFLTLPYAFVEGGLLLSSFLVIFAFVLVDLSKDLMLECMARTEALVPKNTRSGSMMKGGDGKHKLHVDELSDEKFAKDGASLPPWLSSTLADGNSTEDPDLNDSHPNLIVKERKFEVSDLCDLHLGNGMSKIYTVVLCFYMYIALWVYSSVFSSAMTASLPIKNGINGNDGGENDADYYIYAAIFSIIVVPLSCLELEEQVFVQLLLTAGRLIMVAFMVGTVLPWGGSSLEDKFSFGYHGSNDYDNGNEESMSAPLFHFAGLYFSFPIILWSFIFHHSIPVLSNQIEDKDKLGWIFRVSFIILGIAYLLVGLMVGWYFGKNVKQSSNLNWKYYTGGTGRLSEDGSEYIDIAWWARFISTFVVIFPAVDVISAFPLHAITLGNNLVGCVYGDRVAEVKRRTSILFRLLSSIPPIIGSLFVKRLGVLTDYAGTLGFVIALCFPALLFIYSQRKAYCKRIRRDTFYKTFLTTEYCATGLFVMGAILTFLVLMALLFGDIDY